MIGGGDSTKAAGVSGYKKKKERISFQGARSHSTVAYHSLLTPRFQATTTHSFGRNFTLHKEGSNSDDDAHRDTSDSGCHADSIFDKDKERQKHCKDKSQHLLQKQPESHQAALPCRHTVGVT